MEAKTGLFYRRKEKKNDIIRVNRENESKAVSGITG